MLPWGVGVGAAMPTISISYTETGHSAHLLQGWQLHLSVLQGQWDSTWDVEDLRDAKQNIDRARKTKIQKLRADQEQERRDMETHHKQAVEEVSLGSSERQPAHALGMQLAGSGHGLPGQQPGMQYLPAVLNKGATEAWLPEALCHAKQGYS